MKEVDLKDLVFLDEMGVLLGLTRSHARAAPGERAYDYKPFYRGSKVSVIGAITVSKVLAVMTLDDSMCILISDTERPLEIKSFFIN
ncbi:MAG: transposase [Pleurocapsa sp.]